MRSKLSTSRPLPQHRSTEAFLDSSSLHDAFAALRIGKPELWTMWVHRCLVDSTYLLLFSNVQIIPGPASATRQPLPGDERALVSELPTLVGPPISSQAGSKLRRWLSLPKSPLSSAWRKTIAEPEFEHWCALRRELFWEHHAQANIGLFNPEFISTMAPVLGVSEKELREIHALSTNLDNVRSWANGGEKSAAQLADQAYVLSGLIRGKFHEYTARDCQIQLAAHPSRAVIAGPTEDGIELPSTNTSQYFVRLLIGSALRERERHRVSTWRQNVLKARDALSRGSVKLPNLADGDAEALAIRVARRIGIEVASRWQRRLLSGALETNLALYSSLLVGPWGLMVAAGTRLYKLVRGRSVTDDLVTALVSDSEFDRLARAVPGRITRKLLPPPR